MYVWKLPTESTYNNILQTLDYITGQVDRHPDNIRIGNDVVIADGDGFHVRGTRNDVLLRGGVLSIFGLALLPMTASRAVSVVGELTPRSSAPM